VKIDTKTLEGESDTVLSAIKQWSQ